MMKEDAHFRRANIEEAAFFSIMIFKVPCNGPYLLRDLEGLYQQLKDSEELGWNAQ